MEKVAKRRSCEQRDMMIKQLVEGIEAAKELQKRILSSSPTNKHQLDKDEDDDNEALINHSLLDKMLSSFDNTISIAKLINVDLQQLPLIDINDQQQPSINSHFEQAGSPTHSSLALSSPSSENSQHQLHDLSKKRKMMPRWNKRVNVGEGVTISGLEGALDDGFCWRKYGQKDILNAKFPRGYYRCTHRHTQSCQATKQVQRSDENPSIYHVIYRGEHTCIPVAQQSKAQSKPIEAQPKPEQNPKSPQEQEVYLGLGPNEILKIELTQTESPAHIFRSFPFKTAQLDSGPTDNFLLGFSPNFGSPATSESSYFPLSPCPVTGPGARMIVQISESEWNGSISGPSSVSNSPMGCEFEFPIDQLLDIDAAFPNFEF